MSCQKSSLLHGSRPQNRLSLFLYTMGQFSCDTPDMVVFAPVCKVKVWARSDNHVPAKACGRCPIIDGPVPIRLTQRILGANATTG